MRQRADRRACRAPREHATGDGRDDRAREHRARGHQKALVAGPLERPDLDERPREEDGDDARRETAPACTQDGAGRKMMRFLRDVPDGGASWSFDLLWGGPSPGANPYFGYWKHSGSPNGTHRSVSYQPENLYNQVVTHAVYMKAASSNTAADGVLRIWVNGALLGEWTNIPMGSMGFHRFQWPMIVRGPVHDMTEYWWDIVAWSPN